MTHSWTCVPCGDRRARRRVLLAHLAAGEVGHLDRLQASLLQDLGGLVEGVTDVGHVRHLHLRRSGADGQNDRRAGDRAGARREALRDHLAGRLIALLLRLRDRQPEVR